jgi:hypothetical protein
MAILKYNASPRPTASMKNVNYILRDDACIKFEMVNLPEIETKIDARSYAATREIEEQLMPKRGTGTARNHHRMMITMPDENDPDKALQLAKNFVEKEFPGTRSIIAIHESENVTGLHSHVWFDARKLDGKKLDLGTKYTKLDKLYSQKYDEIYGTNYTREFAEARKFNQENEIPTYSNQLQILVERKKQNDERRTQSGKHIIATAARRIDELNVINGTRLEIASWHFQRERERLDKQRPDEKRGIASTQEQPPTRTRNGMDKSR